MERCAMSGLGAALVYGWKNGYLGVGGYMSLIKHQEYTPQMAQLHPQTELVIHITVLASCLGTPWNWS